MQTSCRNSVEFSSAEFALRLSSGLFQNVFSLQLINFLNYLENIKDHVYS
jgi:hypothetical protein